MGASKGSTEVGRVVAVWRYPVKSMGAEPLEEVDVSWHGLAGDRRWAFLRDDRPQSGFPWLTLRDRADLALYSPYFTEPGRPDSSPTSVRTPGGRELDVTDPVLAQELWGSGARVLRQDRGVFDTFPLSLLTTATLEGLSRLVDRQLDVQRFRPNLLIEPRGDRGPSFPEDAWVGARLRIGSLRLRVDKRDGRCEVITIDPQTTERDASILRTVASERQGCLGVYGSIVTPGRVSIGDAVLIESWT